VRAAWSTGNPFRPFCSERCKLIDLGAWATEQYRVPDGSAARANRTGEDSENDTQAPGRTTGPGR